MDGKIAAMYEKEMQALKKAGRFRERLLFGKELVDLASNDYLGLSGKKKQTEKNIQAG